MNIKTFACVLLGTSILLSMSGCSKEDTALVSSTVQKTDLLQQTPHLAAGNEVTTMLPAEESSTNQNGSKDKQTNQTSATASSAVASSSVKKNENEVLEKESKLTQQEQKELAIKKDYFERYKRHASNPDAAKLEDVQIIDIYLSKDNYEVVKVDGGFWYADVIEYEIIGNYVFSFGSSNVFTVHYNNTFMPVEDAYKQGIINEADLTELYNNFPNKWKMTRKEYEAGKRID